MPIVLQCDFRDGVRETLQMIECLQLSLFESDVSNDALRLMVSESFRNRQFMQMYLDKKLKINGTRSERLHHNDNIDWRHMFAQRKLARVANTHSIERSINQLTNLIICISISSCILLIVYNFGSVYAVERVK